MNQEVSDSLSGAVTTKTLVSPPLYYHMAVFRFGDLVSDQLGKIPSLPALRRPLPSHYLLQPASHFSCVEPSMRLFFAPPIHYTIVTESGPLFPVTAPLIFYYNPQVIFQAPHNLIVLSRRFLVDLFS